jgi:magnesium-protoporphyrin IX monomethyl ester (oxidative) cyclase
MKFLFIYPSGRGYRLADKKTFPVTPFSPPLGILYLSSILEHEGHEIDIIDFTAENVDESTLKNRIFNADAIGVSIGSHSCDQAKNLTQFIRECDKDIPLLIGGPHCTLLPKESLVDYNADICIAGEGEQVINSISNYLMGKEKLSNIPGLYYWENRKIKQTTPSQIIKDLDKLVFPARHLVEKYDYGYFGGEKLMKGKTTGIITTRGCPYHCTFCGYGAIYSQYHERSVDNVIKEFDEIVSQGYQTVAIVDNNFLANKKRAEKIMDEIIQKKMGISIWILGLRVDSVDRRIWEKMRDAGVEFLSFGIESGCQEILDYYHKRITLKQIKKAINLSKEMGFIASGSFVIGAPIETEENIRKTIEFAKTLPLDVATFMVLSYVYGSPLWKDGVEKGLIHPEEYGLYANSSRGLGNFSEDELKRFCRIAYRHFYFNPQYVRNQIIHILKTRDLHLIKIGLKMFTLH